MSAVRNWHVTAATALFASSAIAVVPLASPLGLRLANLDVRLASVDDLTNSLTGGPPITSYSDLVGDLTSLNDSLGLSSLSGLDSSTSDLGSQLTSGLGSLLGASDTAGPQNILYNLFADVLNIPYYESLAAQEEGYALGPPGSTGGVPGWIPPGATVENGGIDPDTGQYTFGGTGSYWYESVGNTWGWDDGNWPQVDGLTHFVLPFKSEENFTEYAQLILQAEAIDGSTVNCQFECSSFPDYLGRWFHVPLSQVLSPNGYTYPAVEANTVGTDGYTGEVQNASNGIINVSPPKPSIGFPNQYIDPSTPDGSEVIWSGQHVTASNPFEQTMNDLMAPPADDPIQIPSLSNLLLDAEVLAYDVNYDFNPFELGGFAYWGAPTLYSIPSQIGGLLHDFTGLPNEFLLANHGAEPLSGYTSGPQDILPGLAQGFQFLLHGADGDHGLLGYLDPSTYDDTTSADLDLPSTMSASADLAGGTDAGTLSADLAGVADPGTMPSDLGDLLSSLF
jgi:hypothetical protein